MRTKIQKSLIEEIKNNYKPGNRFFMRTIGLSDVVFDKEDMEWVLKEYNDDEFLMITYDLQENVTVKMINREALTLEV